MASAINPVRSPFFSRDELRFDVQSDLFVAPTAATGWIKLNGTPADGDTWLFKSAKGSFLITWKTVVTQAGRQVSIGSDEFFSHQNAVTFLNNHYLFSRYWIAAYDGPNFRISITARSYGIDYALTDSVLAAPATSEFTAGTNPVVNLQVGLIIRPRSDANVVGDIVFEAAAPIPGDTNAAFFYLDRALHALTEFNPPGIMQDEVEEAPGHMARYDLSLYDVSGVPPEQSLLSKTTNRIIVRGGSRVENYSLYNNFLMDFLVGDQNGVLHNTIGRFATEKQELYTYWFNAHGNDSFQVFYTIQFNDGTSPITVLVDTFSAALHTVHIIPAGIANTSVLEALEAADKAIESVVAVYFSLKLQFSGALIANLSTVYPEATQFGEKYFLFENSYGGAEVVRLTGAHSEGVEVSKEVYRKLNIPSQYWQRRKIASRKLHYRQMYKCSTGLRTWEQILGLIDLVISENVWEIVYEDSVRFPIEIQPGTFTLRQFNRDGQHFYSFSFEYGRAYEEQSTGLNNNFF